MRGAEQQLGPEVDRCRDQPRPGAETGRIGQRRRRKRDVAVGSLAARLPCHGGRVDHGWQGKQEHRGQHAKSDRLDGPGSPAGQAERRLANQPDQRRGRIKIGKAENANLDEAQGERRHQVDGEAEPHSPRPAAAAE